MGKENHTMGESREYMTLPEENGSCLLYTSDAADD